MKKIVSWLTGAVLTVAASLAMAADYQEGVHFTRLDKPVRTADPEKIEVVEMFGYWCPHCDHFESLIQPWKKTLADDVVFKPIPVAFRNTQIELAKAYHLGEILGVIEQTHSAMFDLYHRQGNKQPDREDLQAFFANYGVSQADFDKAYDSFSLNSRLAADKKKARDYRISGVPTLVVNGKYVVGIELAGSQENMLKIADYLVAKERSN